MTSILVRALLCLVLACGLAPARAADPVVAAGPPALTQSKLKRIADFFEWIFKAPLDPEQRQRIESILVAEWGDPNERPGLQEMLSAADEVDRLPAEQRPLAREQLLKAALPELRKSAKTDANAKWFLGLYQAANKPLAKGPPSLTRHASDAHLGVLMFTIGKGHGIEIPIDDAARNAWAQALADAWPKLDAEQRKEIAKAPVTLATVRAAWDAAPPKERAEAAAQWKAAYPLPAAAQAAAPQTKTAAAPAAPAKTAAAAGTNTTARNMQAAMFIQQQGAQMLAFQQQMHMQRSNMIANWGNSPYRYVNRFGNPY